MKRQLLVRFGIAVLVAGLAASPHWALDNLKGAKAKMAERHAQEAVVMGPSSSYIELAVRDDSAQFTMGEPGGGPILLYGHPNPWSSYTSIVVDGTAYTNQEQPFGAMIQTPTVTGNTNESIWQVGSTPIQVHQIITLVNGSATGNPDTYFISYKVVNTDTAGHTVACRIMFDTDLDNNDGAPFQVPGTGSVTMEQEWDAAQVPPYFFVFNDLSNPSVTAQGSLVGGSVSPVPDKFQIAAWPNVWGTAYDYTVDPTYPITSDSCYNVFWNTRDIAPGQSITFGTYYGLGGISVDVQPPLVTALTAPSALDCVNSQYTPNPFTISLYVSNTTPGVSETVTGISATLSLPAGLSLASGTLSQTIPDEAPGASHLVSWQVLADGSVTGILTYSIQLNSANAGSKTLTKTVDVPQGCLTNCPTISIVSVNGSTCPNPTVTVSVTEPGGSPITGLTSAAFCLSENGVSTPVAATAGAVAGQYVLTFATSDTSTADKSLDVCVTAEGCTVHAQGRYHCTCVLSCGVSGVPTHGAVNVPVTFTGTVTATGCAQNPSFSWSFGDGTPAVSGQTVTHAYAAAGTYSWTMTVTANGVTCTVTQRILIVLPPNVTSIKKSTPFSLICTGSNLQNGITVSINGVPWSQVQWKNTGKFKITGGGALKAKVPKGVTTTFLFTNTDGGQQTMTWSW